MKERESHEFDDLEPLHPAPAAKELPELPDEHELADLPHDVELHEEPAPPATAPAAGGAGASEPAAGRARSAPDAAQAKRELDRAPLELRKAAIVLLAGSVFPWADPSNPLVGPLVEKVLCFLAVWILYQTHVLKHTGKASGLVMGLGKQNLKVPMIVAGVIALLGLIPIATTNASPEFWPKVAVVMEKAFLLLAGYTFVHIYDYEHGGKFNPLFPLLFLFPAVAGFVSIFTKVLPQLGDNALAAGLALVGAALVALGGLIACHTMYVAMKEAKAHGEAKKAAAAEARKAAREARQGGGAARTPGARNRR